MKGYLVDRCPRCHAWMPRATPQQHGALQATLEDIARHRDWPPGSGRLIGPSQWWELLVAGFDRLEKRELLVLPAVDGVGFDGNGFDFVRGPRRRRNLNNIEISEVIEYVRSWAVWQAVPLREFNEGE